MAKKTAKTKKTATKPASSASALKRRKQPTKKDEGRYWQATGRRKTAVARIRIKDAKKTNFVVNQKPFED